MRRGRAAGGQGGRGKRLLLGLCLNLPLCPSAALPLFAQCPDGTPPPCSSPIRARARPMDSSGVAVLYLASVSRDTSATSIAEGLTEEIIARLSQVRGLHPASRHASSRYRDRRVIDPEAVGRELGVRYVLEGSVRRIGERLRVVLVMSDASVGFNVWGRTFERGVDEIFSIQDSVAISVAEAVLGRLSSSERAQLVSAVASSSPEAYQALLRARVAIRRRTAASASHAVDEYRRAIAFDPSYARAWAGLAHALSLAREWGWLLPNVSPDSVQILAERAAARALALDSTAADSWLAAAMAERANNVPRALRLHERAARLDSTSVEVIHQLAWGLVASGALDSAIAVERAAIRLDPYYGYAYSGLAEILNSGRPAEAAEAARQGLTVDSGMVSLHWQLGMAMLGMRQPALAMVAIERAQALGADSAGVAVLRAVALLMAGDAAGVRAQLPALERMLLADSGRAVWGLAYNSAGILSGLYAQLGDADNAVRWLERVATWPRRFYAVMYRRHWLWEPVRDQAAFRRFLARLAS